MTAFSNNRFDGLNFMRIIAFMIVQSLNPVAVVISGKVDFGCYLKSSTDVYLNTKIMNVPHTQALIYSLL